MIVTLHSGSHGGYLDSPDTIINIWQRFINALCLCSVNLFVLISGYFLVFERFRFSKLLKLCIEVWFYSIIIWLFVYYRGGGKFASVYSLKSFFPISFQQYWFVTAYVGMYCLSPVINLFVKALSRKQHFIVICILVFLFSIYSDIIIKANPFQADYGYSMVWFIVLYIIASYIKIYNVGNTMTTMNRIKCLWIVAVCSIIIVLSYYLLSPVEANFPFLTQFKLAAHYFKYNAFLVLVSSILLFMVFKGINVKLEVMKRIIVFLAPLTFGVYLIHDSLLIKDFVWKETDILVSCVEFVPLKQLFSISFVFFICSFIDYFRKTLFDWIFQLKHIKLFLSKADEFPRKVFDRLYRILTNIKLCQSKY